MRTTAVLSALLLSAGLVAGCGSDDGGSSGSGSDYCADLKAAKADFEALDSSTPDFDAFSKAIDTFHDLADAAPSEIAEEWKTLDGAFTTLESDLEDAGLSLEDLGAITRGEVPEGMTAEDLAEITPKLQAVFTKLDDDKFEKAGDEIEKHAKSECDIDLSAE